MAGSDRKQPAAPIPSLLPEHGKQPWTVAEGDPATDTVARHITAPLRVVECPRCGIDHGRHSRAHEMTHAAISPAVGLDDAAKDAGVRLDAYAAAEEMRVNRVMADYAPDAIAIPGLCPDAAQSAARTAVMAGKLAESALVYAGTIGTKDAAPVRRGILEADPDAAALLDGIDQLAALTRGWDALSPAFTPSIGRALEDALEGYERDRHGKEMAEETERAAAAASDRKKRSDDAPELRDMKGRTRGLIDSMKELFGDEDWEPSSGPTNWCPMTVEHPPLVRKATGRFSRDYRPTDTGAVLLFPERHADGRMFTEVRTAPGGTVLVDCSGSMGLERDDVAAILHAVPGATVATYNGNGRTGVLRIIARRGRTVGPDEPLFGRGTGNCVDGPALDWLATQQRPRVWVCDGGVTGMDDEMTDGDVAYCDTVARQARIRRVPEVQALLDELERR